MTAIGFYSKLFAAMLYVLAGAIGYYLWGEVVVIIAACSALFCLLWLSLEAYAIEKGW